ncbi:hypothetical protein MNB_SUP05-SYMBIONT-5-368 [hydrothermal vent metagenome]|uniref:Uncharacterized protein n=1 Tax=hydrothermal vent metagenome TaxID=652676 RepID=A0A1W1E5G8_9ZZZZ
MKKIITLALLLLFSEATLANKAEVWLFGTKEQVFTQTHRLKSAWIVKHYLIDGGRDFEAKISQGLSKNKNKAMRQVKQRFVKHKAQWVNEAKKVWQGAINAQSLNIDKVPAITFDKGKTVIYGITNLPKALKIYKRKVK